MCSLAKNSSDVWYKVKFKSEVEVVSGLNCPSRAAKLWLCRSTWLTQRGWRAQQWSSIVYCVTEGVLCVFSQCAAKGRSVSEVSTVNGGHRTPSPLYSGEETPPIESTEAECSRPNKMGAKGFLSGSLPSSSLGIPGNQVWLLEPACREEKAQRHLYSSADVQHYDLLWDKEGRRCELPCDFVWGLSADTWRDLDIFFYIVMLLVSIVFQLRVKAGCPFVLCLWGQWS